MKYAVLYNPYAGNGKCLNDAKKLDNILKDAEIEYVDMTKISDYKECFSTLDESVKVIIAGGDGTLNRFVNDPSNAEVNRELLYFPAGSGNDFYHDLELEDNTIVELNKYITNLPVAEINGKKYKFINGIGYGIDGYCCEVGDKLRESNPGKEINYTSIAIKGLLFGYKRTSAKVTIDGVTKNYKHAWLAPTMNGRFYGGGMNAAPTQNRLNKDGTVSLLVMYCISKLWTLIVFPSIFKGEHIKHTGMVECMSGHDIEVEFDKPTALQVDGETVLGVTKYHVYADEKSRHSHIN